MVQEIDRGWNDYARAMAKLDGLEIVGGLFGEQAEIGLYNEKGTDRIPARPFMKITARRVMPKLKRKSGPMVQAVKAYLNSNGDTTKLYSLGAWLAVEIQKTIESNVQPPNAESTLKRKRLRSTKTLVDYGNMLRAVTFRVREKQ
ncbi:hypothetical protein COW20_18910 [bacterium (Candidatus Blackallbacteria) CG13_big_fil_rev_8_21_14_2_50_49_14]|nr:MAG: hypothetical protein COW64_12225 [bacterium (Candidatus Blackallbacteria) CG18_big_fil_WC_8_21_14_2_50_49_26]PIW45802.1 MAG: hypothetical protein COW20_18910 [bacterium (Candidatus Blackallbacteria) CG13_big_fil_rev_8_21_14_2_50_49_14]